MFLMKKERFNLFLNAVITLALLLLAENARLGFLESPFTTALYVSLCFCGQSLGATSLCYLISGAIYGVSVQRAISRGVAVLVEVCSRLILKRIKKHPSLATLNLFTLLCRAPEIALAFLGGSGVYNTIIGVIVGQVFAYVCGVSLQAILVRGVRIRFTIDELVCMGVGSIVLLSGLYGFSVLEVRPFYAVSAFCTLLTVYALGPYGVVIGTLFALGAGIGGDVGYILPLTCGALVCLAFRCVSPYLASIGFCVAVGGVGYFFLEGAFLPQAFGAMIFGTIAFCLLPYKAMLELAVLMSAIRERYGGRGIVNRNRMEISRRLSSLASLFWDTSALVVDTIPKSAESEDNVIEISESVVRELCGDCPKKEECDGILGGKARELIEPIVLSAVKRGKATLLELPPYMTGSCAKVSTLIPTVNKKAEEYASVKKERSYTTGGKLLFGKQLFETGELLGSIAVEMRKGIGFDTAKERLVMDELAYKNVVCSEVVIESGAQRVALLVKNALERRKTIEKTVGKVMKRSMCMSIDEEGESKGFDLVILEPRAPYDMAFGEACLTKGGEIESGDSRLILRPARDRYILAIADGMGSGEKAGRASSRAVSMIESFYKAGFAHEAVVSLVNRLLTFSGEDCYNTLDMCVCDMKSKKCDFIKLGACPAFIKRQDLVETIEGESLPMGVLQEITPTIVHKELHAGDMIVLTSDGVTDSIGVDELRLFIEGYDTPNPQEMANAIKKRATEKGALDDVSVAVGKIYQVVR